jgi:predicted RND superfamily exporter protein
MDTSNESSFPEADIVNQQNKKFEAIFGNEDFVFLLIEADEVFDHEVLAYIRELSKDLEANLPFLDQVTALTDVEYIEARDGNLYVEDLIGAEIPATRQELEDIKQKVLSKEVYVDRLVSTDTRATGISIEFQELPEYVYLPVQEGFSPLDELDWPADKVIMQDQIFTEEEAQERDDLVKVPDSRKLILPALRVILDRHQHPDYTVKAAGEPVVDFELDAVIGAESAKFVTLTLIIALMLLVAIFRSATGVVAPFLVIVSSIILTYGMVGWSGFPMSTEAVIIAPLLLVIAVSYSIHVIHHFRHAFRQTGNRRGAIEYAFEHATWPCFLTALTTAMGFVSFVVVEIIPIRRLGLICAAGAMMTYVLVITLIPILFSFGRDKPKVPGTPVLSEVEGSESAGYLPKRQSLMTKWADVVIKYGKVTGVVTPVLFVILIVFSSQIRVDPDWIIAIGERVPFVRDAKHVAANLGGIYSYEILIELPEPDMAKEPGVLQALEELDAMIHTYDTTNLTMSINTLIKDINMTMHNNERAYFTVPESRDLIAQYLLLYEMSGGEELDEWVDYDYQNLRISVQINRHTSILRDRFEAIEAFGQRHFPAGTGVTITGDIPIILKSGLALIEGQIRSIILALVAISAIMMIVLKSVRVGTLAMIPNILPVAVTTGLMGIFGVPLNEFTILVAPIIIGIAVDDTMHYFIHFKQEFQKWGDYRQANRETFRKVGPAIIFTSVILTLGFSTFGLAIINSMVHVALLLAACIFSALLADLCITPTLFVFLKPFGNVEREMEPYEEVETV